MWGFILFFYMYIILDYRKYLVKLEGLIGFYNVFLLLCIILSIIKYI